MKTRTSLMLCVMAVIGLAWAPVAQAETIYYDDFSGGSEALNGTTPDTTPTGSETWSVSGTWQADGYTPAWWVHANYASLPFVPASGSVYTLSVDLDVDPYDAENYNSDWLAVAFQNSQTEVWNSPAGFLFKEPGPGDVQSFLEGAGTAEGSFGSGLVNFKMVLDTQPALWEIEYFVGGSSVRGPVAFTTNPTISQIGLHTYWMCGLADNLTLETVEPTVYWDINGSTAGAGGATPAGTWDATNTYWNDTADGTGTTAAWAAGDTAVFAAGGDATGAYTVTVDGTQPIGGLTFEEGTVTLSGGTALQLVANAEMNVASGLTATVTTDISEDAARSLTKAGDGTLVLSGANTYTGGVAVTGGTLVGHTGSIRGDVTLSGGTNVTFNQGSDASYDGVIAGDGSFTKTGAGTLEVTSEAHTYNGGTTVSAGTLRVTGWLPADSTVTVEDGGTLGGAGRVGPIDLLPGGTLAPGASVGTLTADGDVTFADGGNKWVAELLGADADRVTVTSYGDSTLTLGDATALELVIDGADPFEAGTYTLASYDNLVGTFSSVTDLGAYSTGVAYGATAITIELLANLLPGDATLDRTVDLDDFARLRNNFGTGDTWAEADFNGDDTVNLDDFAILRNNFGAHAPEPATLAILAMGGAWLAFRRRRHGTKGTKGTGMRSALKKMAGGLVAAVLALVVAAGACQASTIMEIQIDVNTGQAYLFNPSGTPGDWASVVGYTITSAGSNLLPADSTLPVGTGEWADSWLSLADQTVEFLPPPPPGMPNAYYNAALMAGEWARPELSATTSDLTDGTLGSGLWLDAGESVYIGKVVAPPGGWVEGRYGPGAPHSDLAFRILEYEAPASEASYVNLVPEPATLALIGLGGFSVLLRRKRR